MSPAALTLQGWRNAPFPPEQFFLTADGGALDITSRTLGVDVRVHGGAPVALIRLDTTDSPAANGVHVLSAVGGAFRLQIDQPTMQAAWDAVHGAGQCKAGEPARLVFDLRLEHPDGFAEVVCEGPFIIQPGITL